jgi:dihydroorotate dehydrogenase electron transfer subunit
MRDSPVLRRRGTFPAAVKANDALCREHFRLVLALEVFPPSLPGQFIQLLCRPPGEQARFREVEWSARQPPTFTQPELTAKYPLLRRPLSLAGRRDGAGGAELTVIYRTIGTGTHWLATVEPGAQLSVLGPLGNAFAVRAEVPAAALVGGGVGIPPMIYLAEALAAAGKRTVAFNGVRTADLLPLTPEPLTGVDAAGGPAPCVAEFAASGAEAVVATDDGSLGFRGPVSAAFAGWLEGEGLGGEDVVVYACGPEAMMRAVADACLARGVECQLALERHMACGMGTCQSCNVKVRDAASPEGWSYKLCCTDGPVFDAAEVLW